MFESELELQADCVELFPALHVCLFTLSSGVKQLCQNFSSEVHQHLSFVRLSSILSPKSDRFISCLCVF